MWVYIVCQGGEKPNWASHMKSEKSTSSPHPYPKRGWKKQKSQTAHHN